MHIFSFGIQWNNFLKWLCWFLKFPPSPCESSNFPHPCQHLMLSFFLIIAILEGIFYGLNFHFPGDQWHWAQHVLYTNWLLEYLICEGPVKVFCSFFCWVARNSLYFLEMSLLQISFLFTFIIVSFNEQMFLILIRSSYQSFPFSVPRSWKYSRIFL